jgi:hypothetical protein
MSLYLLPIVALPLLMLVVAFLIVPTQWFALRTVSPYLLNLAYGAKLVDRDCQVLIYGDSSAMVGLNPTLIQQKTGLTTCNIAEYEGITLVSHSLLVDMFLQHNPRPRFIVFFYSPEDLTVPNDWAGVGVATFEAISFRMEYARNLETVLLLAAHPGVTFSWAEQGMRQALLRIHAKPVSLELAHLREPSNGQLPLTGLNITGCDASLHDRPPDLAWIGGLRSRYGVGGTRVLVDAAPTADCDASLGFFQQHLDGVVDNTPYQPIPVSSFVDNGRMHVNREGSQLISIMVANQIANQLPPARAAASQSSGGR